MRIAVACLVVLMVSFSLAAQEEPQAAFFKAISARDLAAVRAMLDADPALAGAKRADGMSAVNLALAAIKKGEESFPDPATNEVLKAILARTPMLDVVDTAAVGTRAQLEKMLAADPGAIKRPMRVGWTLLHIAAFAGNSATTELLIERGADINARAQTRFRNTPLQTALLTGQYATAKVLLDHGADALVRQAKGFTPMHEAALLGRADIVRLLLDHGAELNSRSDSGKTPLSEAMRGHHDELAELLKSKGAVVEPVAGE